MRTVFIAVAALVALSPQAFAETRNVRGFDSVGVEGNYRADVAVGSAYSVTVEGPDAARIRTRVEDGTLKVEPVSRPWFGNPRYNAVVHVTLPRLETIAAARGAEVTAIAGGACTDFTAAAAMGAVLSVGSIECESVSATAAMGSQLTLAGTCGDLDVSAAMGADVSAEDLRCRTVDASASMGASLNAYASVSYDASASMGGDIDVSGEGGSGDRHASMGGSISGH